MNNDDSKENEDFNSDDEEIEQLLRANEQLRQQLTSLSLLSASLTAQQQVGEPLICFGGGEERRWLNARSIRVLSLARGPQVNPHFALMVDELQVSTFYPREEAVRVLDQVAGAINQILQPAQRGNGGE